MSFVIDLNLVCLVCLQEGELRSVFDKDEADLSLGEKIMKCSDLCITEEMKIPDKICTSCTTDLNVAYRFRQNCDTANTVFKSIIKQEIMSDYDAVAEITMQDQKIKIPSGLKIKRIQPMRKAAMVKVVAVPETNDGLTQRRVESELNEHDLEEEENYSTADYFENAEILEEDEFVEAYDEMNSQEPELPTIKKENDIKLEKHIKQEKNNLLPPSQVVSEEKQRRGRGRPRKSEKSILRKALEECEIAEEKPKTQILLEGESAEGHQLSDSKFPTPRNGDKTKPVGVLSSRHYSYTPRKKLKAPEVKPAKICEICGNSYKYQHALNSHMRRHRNERPFSCEFCDKAFVSAVELRRHMRVHTGQKPYACKYCERRFSDFGSRIKHERTHTGERPYVCATCGKAFAYAHVLSVHTRTHTGEKKYKCEECGKGFTKKSYLDSHMAHHNSKSILDNLMSIKQDTLEECIITEQITEDDFDQPHSDKTKIEQNIVEEDDVQSIPGSVTSFA